MRVRRWVACAAGGLTVAMLAGSWEHVYADIGSPGAPGVGAVQRVVAEATPTGQPRPSQAPAYGGKADSGGSTPGSDRSTDPGRVIYLTFDDGPDPRWTPQVLRLLAQYQARATFFVIGQSAAQYPQLVSQVRAAGHRVASHTWSHADLTRLSAPALRGELTRAEDAIGEVRCVRPPYGATNQRVRDAVHSRGQRVELWNVDTRDWTKPGANTIAQQAISPARPGAVMLMHDGGGDRSQTVAALETILRTLTERGYQLRPLPSC